MTDLENREAFLLELKERGHLFENTSWMTGLGGHGGVFEDDQLQMVWEVWNASAQREGFKFVPLEISWQKADELSSIEWDKNKHLFCSMNRDLTSTQVELFRLRWCETKANEIMGKYKSMINAV